MRLGVVDIMGGGRMICLGEGVRKRACARARVCRDSEGLLSHQMTQQVSFTTLQ